MAGRLFLVGTPIGNLSDMSPRALRTLESVDVVAAEDTRRTGRLLAHFGTRARRLVSFFEGNERERSKELLDVLAGGGDVAVVTDAGMPGISDPGYRIVSECVPRGIEVVAVPGPSAALAALVLSGLPTDRFVFEGFLPRRKGDRARRLEELATDPRTIVMFESPRRVASLLREVHASLGDRRVAVARELTKLHEPVLRGRVSEILQSIADAELKGEVALVLEGGEARSPAGHTELADEARALVDAGMRRRDAARTVAEQHGASANAIYRELVNRR